MSIVTVIGRRWWAFPLALIATLVLITAVAASSARADGGVRPAVVPASAMDLGGLFLPAGKGDDGGEG
ncbi:MAG: hypothetical protein CMM77_16420, partial [Rhodospirillaceae bacterium]|nr:hypothetical protein [Rhodospirillaceae bacterium]